MQDENLDHLLPFQFATLEPVNEAAKRSIDQLGQKYDGLDNELQQNIQVEPGVQEISPPDRDEDVSDAVDEHTAPMPKFVGRYTFRFTRDSEGKLTKIWTIGRGSNEPGKTPGVSHLIYSDKGIAAKHMSILFDGKSGNLSIVAHNKQHGVTIFQGNGKRIIHEGEKHIIVDMVTGFEIGALAFNLVLKDLDTDGRGNLVRYVVSEIIFLLDVFVEHEALVKGRLRNRPALNIQTFIWCRIADVENTNRIRNKSRQEAGEDLPDSRVHPYPTKQPFNRVGSTAIHRVMAKGGWGTIFSGVDIRTGDVIAVKQMAIFHFGQFGAIEDELWVNLHYRVCIVTFGSKKGLLTMLLGPKRTLTSLRDMR